MGRHEIEDSDSRAETLQTPAEQAAAERELWSLLEGRSSFHLKITRHDVIPRWGWEHGRLWGCLYAGPVQFTMGWY
jgi:hypothetical protein